MAKKSLPPPSPSSDEDNSSEGSSSSDEEQPATTNATPKPVPPSKAKEEEEESDDESESESDEESGDVEEEDDDDKKSRPSVAVPPTKTASESEDDESDSDSEAAKLVTPISSKPMAEVATADKEKANIKSPLFQRIWTLEDELTVLRGLVQFQAERGHVKLNNTLIRDFYDFIKKKLSVEATSTQLVAKLKTLKKKYSGIAARLANGKPVQPLKPHDNAIYELGKKIWAEEDECNGRVLNGVVTNGAVESLKAKCPFLKDNVGSMGKRCAEEHLEILDITKAELLEKKLKKQKMTVYKRGMQEGDLTKEMLKIIIEGIDRATS